MRIGEGAVSMMMVSLVAMDSPMRMHMDASILLDVMFDIYIYKYIYIYK